MIARPPPAVVGRHARLDLSFAYRSGRTVLSGAYAEPPFRLSRPFDLSDGLGMILTSSSPGIFPGDDMRQRVRVESGARVTLVSQAALQAHPGLGGTAAALGFRCEVAEGGDLSVHADPVIPFAGSRLAQRIDLQLATGSRFYWGDAVMSGRCGRGERWALAELGHELRLTIGGSLKYLERYRVTPEERRPEHPWAAAGADYLATTLLYHEDAKPERAEMLQRQLSEIVGIRAGVDCPSPNLLVCRLLGKRGPLFAAARLLVREIAAPSVHSRCLYLRK